MDSSTKALKPAEVAKLIGVRPETLSR